MLSRHRQYSFDCSSMIREAFFCATFATAMTISLVLRQFSSVLVARKREVAAIFYSEGAEVSEGFLALKLQWNLVRESEEDVGRGREEGAGGGEGRT